MSKSVVTETVAQNINATLSTEDIPMNENVTLAQLNAEAEAKAENKEKKEKFSLSRTLSPTIEKIEKALSGNSAQIKALDRTLKVLLDANLDTGAVLAKIDALRKDAVEITEEFERECGKALIEAVRAKNAQ